MLHQAVILLAEDRDDDILLITRAFAKADIHNPFQVVRDGEEAIAYLKGAGPYSNRNKYPLPQLLLLDLKMPRMDGFEVLRWIRRQPGMNNLPVVVLTSSEDTRDVKRAYQLGATFFMTKSMDFEDTIQMSRLLAAYWLRPCRTPQMSRG